MDSLSFSFLCIITSVIDVYLNIVYYFMLTLLFLVAILAEVGNEH